MNYPNDTQVEEADRMQLARWVRFLPSPGINALESHGDFQLAMDIESKIMHKICQRFESMGGMSPEISKWIGW